MYKRQVENNVAKGSPWACFGLYSGTTRATLVGNTASGCRAGFDLSEGAHDNTLRGNTSNNNVGGNGFSLGATAVSNVLTDNTANRNNYGFIVQEGATQNTLAYNSARANAELDALQWDRAADNIWTHNNFGTSSGF